MATLIRLNTLVINLDHVRKAQWNEQALRIWLAPAQDDEEPLVFYGEHAAALQWYLTYEATDVLARWASKQAHDAEQQRVLEDLAATQRPAAATSAAWDRHLSMLAGD